MRGGGREVVLGLLLVSLHLAFSGNVVASEADSPAIWKTKALEFLRQGNSAAALGPLVRLYRAAATPSEKILWLEKLSDLYYREKLWEDGSVYFRAWHELEPGGLGTLRWAEYQAFVAGDREEASQTAALLKPGESWSSRDRELASLILRTVRFARWDLKDWGLTDPNISALVRDQDDLWIGTWNGGLARYSTATRETTTFRQGEYRSVLTTIRTLAVDPWFVYVGGFEGLWRYSKLTQSWTRIHPPAGMPLERIQDMAVQDRRLVVGTLGAGIWEWEGGEWKSWQDKGWPHLHVNKITRDGDRWLIATMDRGAWEFTPETGKLKNLGEGFPGDFPRNITFILSDDSDLWFGTYGRGLMKKNGRTGSWQIWSAKEGTLQDDFLISGLRTPGGLVFGTLGKGFAYYSRGREKLLFWEPASGGGPADVGTLSHLGDRIILGTLGEGLVMVEEAVLETELP